MQQLFVYIDHNILDWLVKGILKPLPSTLGNGEICWVYSNETLKEIHRSIGSHSELLDCLRKLEAWYLQPEYLNNRPLDTRRFTKENPAERYRTFSEDLLNVGEPELVLARIIPSLMGFKHAKPIDDVMSGIDEYVESLLEKIATELPAAIEELPEKERSELLAQLATLPPLEEARLPSRQNSMNVIHPIEELKAQLGGGPLELNNIVGPKVVEQIWTRIPPEITAKVTIEEFFGVSQGPMCQVADPSLSEKANSVFHMLNFLGYYRDTEFWKDRKLRASMSDMCHVGFGSYCHAFMSADRRLVMKAKAVYEFIGCNTQLLQVELRQRDR